MKLLRQIRVGVIGMPDAGKSTLIKNIVKKSIGKDISVDTLMNEVHWSDGKDPYGNPDTRTIKCAKIIFKYKDVEFCFYDCPGHIEYKNQISQGINGAHCIIKIIDSVRKYESSEYFKVIDTLNKPTFDLYSHSGTNSFPLYDVEKEGFEDISSDILDTLYERFKNDAIDIEEESLRIIKDTIRLNDNNAMFFSGGKDSVVGLDLLSRTGLLPYIKVYFPCSGYDFKEVNEILSYYENVYGISIIPFNNSLDGGYEKHTSYDMLQSKAQSNNKLIETKKIDLVCVQYRASDEGVRSKDYHISDRGTHKRFSPVFYYSETNIWRYITEHSIKVCDLYYHGYRSLGDSPITQPCMPCFNTAEEIISFIDTHPETTERDGRTKQDKSEQFAMEKLRDGGFF